MLVFWLTKNSDFWISGSTRLSFIKSLATVLILTTGKPSWLVWSDFSFCWISSVSSLFSSWISDFSSVELISFDGMIFFCLQGLNQLWTPDDTDDQLFFESFVNLFQLLTKISCYWRWVVNIGQLVTAKC